jgi:hypothetical protein
MVSRRRFSLAFAALAAACLSFTSIAADKPASDAAPPQAVVIYGDRDNGFALATLLTEVGLKCRPVPYTSVTAEWTTDVDLVVIASCCPGGFNLDTVWNKTLLDRVGNARILACGNTGASLLGTKHLLIGHPNGAHWPNTPLEADLNRAELERQGMQLLDKPLQVLDPAIKDDPEFPIIFIAIYPHEAADNHGVGGEPHVSHIGIHDGGAFPEGTFGIARISLNEHHWMISRQGNYTLWGADARIGDITEAGKKLFANLAWHLAHLAPQPLKFPEKVYVEGVRRATLIGGGRDEVYYALNRVGRLNLRLEWEGDATMMLMVHGPVVNRVDGKSPLAIALPVTQNIVGEELKIEVASFALAEGAECPFELSVDLATD